MYKIILTVIFSILLTSCSTFNNIGQNQIKNKKPVPGLFSKDVSKGINLTELIAGNNKNSSYVKVNAYLWRAALNVLSIAPLISTDALGGTIISDWYINENIKNQRLKITVFILSQELRSDGVNVKVHIQNFKDNVWSDTMTDNKLANKIEENILNEARNLRINSLNKK